MSKGLRYGNMFSSFSVNDIDKAAAFYSETLGLDVSREEMGILSLRLPMESEAVMIYPKDDHQPATFTVLNLAVENLEAAVDALRERGIVFEQYHSAFIDTDEQGISRGETGPAVAWFRDPAGNIIAVMEEGFGI